MSGSREGLWYVSQPSRLGGGGHEDYREEVLQQLIAEGYDVIHPFNAFPYDHFEGNPNIGREQAMQYCLDLIRLCEGKLLVTGISDGVLQELDYTLAHYGDKQIKLRSEFDAQWQQQLDLFRKNSRYKNVLGFIALQ